MRLAGFLLAALRLAGFLLAALRLAGLRFGAALRAGLRFGAALRLATLRFGAALRLATLRFGAALRLATLRFGAALRLATLRFGAALRLATLRFGADGPTRPHASQAGAKVSGVSKEAMRVLVQYSWPGNIRELENVIERAITLGAEEEIWAEDLPESLREEKREVTLDNTPVDLSLEEIEKAHIERVLKHTGGQVSQAARILGIDRRTIYRKMEAYKIREE